MATIMIVDSVEVIKNGRKENLINHFNKLIMLLIAIMK